MSGVIKAAATIVGTVVGAVVGQALGGPIGAVIGAAIGASAFNMAANALLPKQPKASTGGQQTRWKADPYAGLPYVMGRTMVSGNIVAKLLKGRNNMFMAVVTVLSVGPINGFETTFMNRSTMAWNGQGQLGGGEAVGAYAGYIWEDRQIGACPELSKVGNLDNSFAEWTDDHKLSGLAAVFNVFCTNAKASNNLGSLPTPGWIIEGVKVYDPRLDSTYPGGSGPCRALDESTYVYSENPHLHGLTWALGRWQNGVRVAGIGAPIASIDMASFVEGANLDDARGWKLGGQVYTRPDTPWNSLKAMLQAGGATPVNPRGIITSINRAPRVSLATITHADIIGKCTFSGTQGRRSRINGVIPQYRSEAHDWEMVSADLVQIPAFVAMDGDERTKEITYPLVQDVTQAGSLAIYDIYDAREQGPGKVPLKPIWMNYSLGDCITFQPEEGWSIKCLITGRSFDPATCTVTLTLRGETDAKHPYALGQTTIAPPVAALIYSDEIAAPTTDWEVVGTSITGTDGSSIPALVITGAVSNGSAEAVVVEYRRYTSGAGDDDGWVSASIDAPSVTRREITSVVGGDTYQVSVRYRVRGKLGNRAIFGPVTAMSGTIAGSSLLPGTVNTEQLATGSVTDSVRVLVAASYNGTGWWNTVATLNIVLDSDAQVDILANAEQGFPAGSRDWGFRVKVDGVTVKEFAFGNNRAAMTDILTIARTGLSLAAGTRVLTLEHAGADSSVSIRNIDFAATRRSA